MQLDDFVNSRRYRRTPLVSLLDSEPAPAEYTILGAVGPQRPNRETGLMQKS